MRKKSVVNHTTQSLVPSRKTLPRQMTVEALAAIPEEFIQGFVRWNENPVLAGCDPSVVAWSSFTTPQRTKWSASFRSDHTVNGRPRLDPLGAI